MNKVHFFTGWETWLNSAIKEFDEVNAPEYPQYRLTYELTESQWSSTRLTNLTSPKYLSHHPNFISTMIRSNLPATLALSEAK